jgi:hypothetical protein
MKTTTLDDIELKARELAEQRAVMAQLVGELQAGIAALMEDQMPAVRLAIDGAAEAWSILEQTIKDSPHLFVKPRTVTMHGIKLGLEKGKGGLEIPDPPKTIALIKKHLADQADVLIDVKETPAKGALAQLPAADLKRVAVNVKDAGDQVVIRPADSQIDKLVRALVRAAIQESEATD